MKKKIFSIVGLILLALSGCASKEELFNGRNLDGWKPYLADASVDPSTVWSVKDGVLRCEGVPNGYLSTVRTYSNYSLHLEWRWVETPTNSGVLLHMNGPDKLWPQCIEAQLKHQDAGDIYLIGGTDCKGITDRQGSRLPKINPTSENTAGQWNRYDIVCRGDTIKLHVNGILQNKATQASVTSGKICLQSEGSPIEFRNIKLRPL
ncbi:MAG TPA: DUF1080 domain-containing protein [Anaerohalosphaeraceae bacterium]|mgnify:FL=1|nr:DUF1080 domain-containing protein [Anaerohalosphaeraceae bacterium]